MEYKEFKITEKKERQIIAPSFYDRVVQHAIDREVEKMKRENRFCPFKNNISVGYTESGKRVVNGKFNVCAGAKCMAYKNGECLRLQNNTAIGLKKAR